MIICKAEGNNVNKIIHHQFDSGLIKQSIIAR